MPQQPLSFAQKRAGIILGQPGSPDHPVVAHHVFQVVNFWSQIDLNLGLMLCSIARGHPNLNVAEIYDQNKSLSLRFQRIREAAQALLPREDYCLIKAAMEEFGPSQKVRNLFCHGIWGILRDQPERWPVMQMETAIEYTELLLQRPIEGSPAGRALENLKIHVWNERDLQEAQSAAEVAHRTLSTLQAAIQPMRNAACREQILGVGNIRRRFDEAMAAQ